MKNNIITNLSVFLENKHVDNALDNYNKFGSNLSDLDKLALYTQSDNPVDDVELKKIDIYNIYRQMGGTFGYYVIQVRVKPVNEQPIDHLFSKECAGGVGWINNYIHYSTDNEAYVSVRFDEFSEDSSMKGGGLYKSRPIMLDNLYPIGIDDIKPEFLAYDKRIEAERKKFLIDLDMDDANL